MILVPTEEPVWRRWMGLLVCVLRVTQMCGVQTDWMLVMGSCVPTMALAPMQMAALFAVVCPDTPVSCVISPHHLATQTRAPTTELVVTLVMGDMCACVRPRSPDQIVMR